MKRCVFGFAFFLMVAPCAARIMTVDPDGPGSNDGSSWANAYNNLQDALYAASNGDEIRVAEGIYRPDRGLNQTLRDQTATFQLISGVTIKGGYAGFGAEEPNARDIEAYPTILDGDLNGDDGPDFAGYEENSYHVVTGSNTDETAVLDGFTITGGRGDIDFRYGAGMFNQNASPTVSNCVLRDNILLSNGYGGGMYNQQSSPTVMNCTFTNNSAGLDGAGGGMYNAEGGSPSVTECTFTGNTAYSGGGMCNDSVNPVVTNCTFSQNSAVGQGGGVYNRDQSSARFSNCVFVSNNGKDGGGMRNSNSSPTLTGCTFRGNRTEGTYASGGGLENFSRSYPSVTNCKFIGNSATYWGGGMFNKPDCDPIVANCVFTGNSADREGGAVFNNNSSPELTNCTLSGNSAVESGGGIFSEYDSHPAVTNCILWSNSGGDGESAQIIGAAPVVNYCCVQGWTGALGGTGNIGDDPLFADADGADNLFGTDDDNLHLLAGSPCINAGDPGGDYSGQSDIDGELRVVDGQVDIGADEFISPDSDDDGISDSKDNCPDVPNTNQLNSDGDAHGDACDNCPYVDNDDQLDIDDDGTGDACDRDKDGDTVSNTIDNCPDIPNPNQTDGDGDTHGDLCDNCPEVPNPDQADSDYTGYGGFCPEGMEQGDDFCMDTDEQDHDDDWYAAHDYCDSLGKRLCTEEEYVYACEHALEIVWQRQGQNEEWRFDNGSCSGDDKPRVDYIGCSSPDYDCTGADRVLSFRCCSDIPVPSPTITIEAYIDGISRLIIRDNTVQWYHIEWVAPGLHGGSNFPTYINGLAWMPWTDLDEPRCGGCYSSIFENLSPPLPQSEATIELGLIRSRHVTSIYQYPSADNDYTLIVEFDDGLPGGPDWYEVEILMPDARDGVGDACDNCPFGYNPDQADADLDAAGNVCDNCPEVFNADQADSDGDGVGDRCDNCPDAANPDQADCDGDGLGDICEIEYILDDFESYSDTAGLKDAWSELGGTWLKLSEFYANGGAHSMENNYYNLGGYLYSEAGRTLDEPQDWTAIGANTLSLAFRGKSTNVPERMYVILEDGKGNAATVTYDYPDNVKTEAWIEWTVRLSKFSDGGVDLSAVKSLFIGLGDRDASQSSRALGYVYFDDIRLISEPVDTDGDGFFDDRDNCPDVPNPDQSDTDGDGVGDACECPCPGDLNRDGWWSPIDVGGLISKLLPHSDNHYTVEAPPGSCADLTDDGWLSPVDLSELVSILLVHKSSYYWAECPQ